MSIVATLDRELLGRVARRLVGEPRVLGGCEEAGCTELHGAGHRFCPLHRVLRRRASQRRYHESRRRVA